MAVLKTNIEDCYEYTPKVFEDSRGYFLETYNKEYLHKQLGLSCDFVQDNQSFSKKGVLRGLHLQYGEFSQSKLVKVVKGRILDVAVDLRKDSSSYMEIVQTELSDVSFKQLYIPAGCAHGFVVLSEEAIVQYKCDRPYRPECETGVLWSDQDLSINWQMPTDQIIVSEKDSQLPGLKEMLGKYDISKRR